MNTLRGKRTIVTGANRGLGEAIARRFYAEGSSVLLCARDAELLGEVAGSLSGGEKSGSVLHITADISIPEEAERVLTMAERAWGGVDVLVNNAGVYGPLGRFHENDWKEWKRSIEINLLGSAYMTKLVLPFFIRQNGGRIIQLSGGGATGPLPNISSYAASKAAVVRFVETIAGEYLENNIFINAIAPGALNTRLLDQVLEAGSQCVGESFYGKALRQRETGGASLETAAALAVFLASDASHGISGRLISAQWDPWERLEDLCDALAKTDVYTIRRIVPADRGLDWEQA